MHTQNNNSEMVSLALKIVEKLKCEYNIYKFTNYKNNSYRVRSLVLQFKMKHVFTSKEYKHSARLYHKNALSLQELKSISQRVFLAKIKECENEALDYFFGNKRLPKVTKKT